MPLVRLFLTILLAFAVGKLVSKIKLPAILGWLIAGMIAGPHAFSVMDQELMDAVWYQSLVHILECAVGLMIGTELVWNKIKNQENPSLLLPLFSHWEPFWWYLWYLGFCFILQEFRFIWDLFSGESHWPQHRPLRCLSCVNSAQTGQ